MAAKTFYAIVVLLIQLNPDGLRAQADSHGGLPCHGCISSCKGSNNSNTWDCYKSGCEECLQRCNIHNCEAIPSVAVSIRTVSLPALQSVSKAALSSSASASLTLSISPSSSQPPPPPPSSLLPYQPPSPTLLSSPFSLFPSPSPSSRPLTLPSPSLSPSQSSLSSPPPSPSPLEPSAPPSSISSPSSSAAAASATPPPPSRPLTLPSPSLSPSQSSLSSPPPSPSPLELSAPPSSISSPSSSAAAVSTTPPSSSSSSTTEELAIKFISTLNKTDVQQANSLQDVVNLLENTIELYKNKSIHEVQMNTTSKEELKAFVFKTAFAFERFALKYGQYHLSDSVPMINNVHSKLVLRIERVFRRNASDFHLEGSEHQNIINIPSNNFDNNGSVLLGIVYTDIHELLEASQFNSKARTTRQLDTVIMAATMDPKPKQLLQNVALKFRNLKAVDETRYCVFWNGYSEKNPDGWSAEGCHAMKSASNWDETVCSCNHMTHFAVLLDYGDNLEITEKDEKILRIVTYVGLALSIMGLILTTISYIHLTDVHQPLSQIRVNLAGSLGAGQVIFLAGINATENTGACVGVAALMQYFLMVAFCWMLVEGIYLYLLVVKVYNINNKMAIYYVMSWGFPVVMVTISLSIAAGKEGIKSYVNDKYCWMSSTNNLIWIFVAFVVLMEILNLSLLVRVIKEMTTMQLAGETRIQQIRVGIKACVVMVPLLGVTWLFGLLSPLHKAFVYIFTILNSAQGFLIFLLHCARNSQIRERFKRKMNAISPSANEEKSIKKTSRVNQSDIEVKAIDVHPSSNDEYELKYM
ncbi:adhesion G-protein coupled receptor D1-like [Oculina patagonica]